MKEFFKLALASFLGLVMFCIAALAVFSYLTAEEPMIVPDETVLVIDLSVPITDKPLQEGPTDLAESLLLGGFGEGITLFAATEAIRRAADDSRITGIYLDGSVSAPGLSSGWAALGEVRDELESFRESGKKIYAFGMDMDERTYYLTSLADELWIHPAGLLEFNGLASERRFYGKAFAKYGIEVQVTRVGKYKSAVEPYTGDRMSPESREQSEKLLGDMSDVFLDAVAAARGIDRGRLVEIASSGGLLEGREAAAAGLADGTAYFDEVLESLKELAGDSPDDDGFTQIDLADYALICARRDGAGNDGPALDFADGTAGSTNRIAVVVAEGEIVDGESEREAGGDTVARLLRRARRDSDVKAVVLRVNSPGGSVSASEVILREMRLTVKEKPVVVSMGSLAASGGYWIACCADEILAQPNTITGSIGVYGMFPNFKGLINDIGVDVDTAKTAPFADVPSLYRPMTEPELAIYQGLVDRVYDEFIDRVAEGRNLDRDTVRVIAQGRVWSGREAQVLGLIDGFGGLADAVLRAAQRAELGRDFSVTFYQKERTLLDDFMALLTGGDDDVARAGWAQRSTGPIAAELSRLHGGLRALDALNDPRSVYARLPCDLTIH